MRNGVRMVVAELNGDEATAFSTRHAVRALIESSWPDRLQMLRRSPELIDDSIANWVIALGDPLLGSVINEATARGLAIVAEELDLKLTLDRLADSGFTDERAVLELQAAAQLAAARISAADARWLIASVIATIDLWTQEYHDPEPTRMREIGLDVLCAKFRCRPESVARAAELARAEWPIVWASLPRISDLAELRSAAFVLEQDGKWFERNSDANSRVRTLAALLDAADQRGADIAVEEHASVLAVDRLLTTEQSDSLGPAATGTRLALQLQDYFGRTGSRWILDAAMRAARYAYQQTPAGHEHRSATASSLGNLIADAVRAGIAKPVALTEAVSLHREAYELTPPDDSNRPACASNLANRLAQCFNAGLGGAALIIESINLLREACSTADTNDANRAAYVSNLAGTMSEAFEAGIQTAEILNEVIAMQREVCAQLGPDHPHRSAAASNLSSLLADAVTAGLDDVEVLLEAVALEREAYALTPPGHPSRAVSAANLGGRLSEAMASGVLDPEVLIEAVSLQREAYELTEPDDPDLPLRASGLASRLFQVMQAGFSDPTVLVEAVDLQRQACKQTPLGHPDRLGYTAILGLLLSQVAGAGIEPKAVLVEAVALLRQVADVAVPTDPVRVWYLSVLGLVLLEAVLAGVEEPTALEEAIQVQREAYETRGLDHSSRASYGFGLGKVISSAVEAGIKDPAAAVEAIELLTDAYESLPPGHADQPEFALELSQALSRGVDVGVQQPTALNQAASLLHETLDRTPPFHPGRARQIATLGGILAKGIDLGVLLGSETTTELNSLMDLAWRSARSASTPLQRRVVSIQLTQLTDAFLPILDNGGVVDAIRAVEALRGHLIGGMRAPRLARSANLPARLAQEYSTAADAYDRMQRWAADGIIAYAASLEVSTNLATVMAEVRATGKVFADFGGRPRIEALASGIGSDSIAVYLIPGRSGQGGSALVLRPDETALQVRLPELTAELVRSHVDNLLARSGHAQTACAWLWSAVAEPLLAATAGAPVARKWIVIPTGQLSMLPIHAAGSAGSGWLDDHVTVTVVPSLTTLSNAEKEAASGAPLIAVSNDSELDFLAADRVAGMRLLDGAVTIADDVSPDAVLTAMQEAPAVLICGHATHSLTQGSGLALGDTVSVAGIRRTRWLTSEAVARLPARARQLAILSACSSGQIATDLPDEQIGLPATFLAIGFRSVVSTAWPVRDRVAFVTTTHFLQNQRANPERPPSEVLHGTRRWLRTATVPDLQRWLAELTTTVPIPEQSIDRLRTWWRLSPDPHPLADPQDWAAYTTTGL